MIFRPVPKITTTLQKRYKNSKDIDLEKNVSYYIHKQENKTKNTKEGEENTNVKK